jgi:uncharacterized protein
MARRFEWNPLRAAGNLSVHKVSFENAQAAWNDLLSHVWIDAREDYGEERVCRLSMVDNRLLFVCYTESTEGQDEVFRIISARKANRHERRIYEEGE